MLKLVTLITMTITILGLSSCSKDAVVGSYDRPFKMYFVPSEDVDQIAKGANVMAKYVSEYISEKMYGKKEGFYVEASIPTSYIAIVEALGTKKADFAAFNTFSYILTKDIKKFPIKAIFSVIRGKDETHYKAQFLAHVDSGIKSIEDLAGRKFAYTDPASTSGYILPSEMLKQKNIKLSETIFARRHDTVVTMIYQGQVEAGATYFSPAHGGKIRDARARVKTQFPDVEDKVKIIGFSEEIPNEPWIIRTNIYKDAKKQAQIETLLKEAVIAFGNTEHGSKAMIELSNATGLSPVDDSVYDRVREIVIKSGIELEKAVKKK